jgi:type I site-specific restriction-modification system R (restriction) subunit
VRVIDWEQPANNDLLLVSQFSVTGAFYACRPDLVGFVNGLPLVVIELKKPGVPVRAAFDENPTHYKQQIPALFWYNALLIASNDTGLPRAYSPDLCRQKCAAVSDHVYESYPERDRGVYSTAV